MTSNNLPLRYNFGVFNLTQWSRRWQNSDKKYQKVHVRSAVRVKFQVSKIILECYSKPGDNYCQTIDLNISCLKVLFCLVIKTRPYNY